MRFSMQLLSLLFGGLVLANFANAESPYVQLYHMVEQLQESPGDNALREQIIRLAQTLKPAPAIPGEAIAFEGRAQFAFKNAKSNDAYLAAAREYEQAVIAAPWVPGYYSAICAIYEKAGLLQDAKRNCETSLIGLADSAQITDIKRKIAGLKSRMEQNAEIAAKKQAEEARGPEMVGIPGKNYEMGKYLVTQSQWKAVMGNNPSYFKNCGDTCPVEEVSWSDVQEFIKKLNAKTGKQFRLPTEDEWEYACNGGSQTEYCGSDDVDSVGWYEKNSGNMTHPVGQKQANDFDLYDMSGNVWEWVQDCHDSSCGGRVLRGGSWFNLAYLLRSTFRFNVAPGGKFSGVGFRLARTLPQ